MDNKKIGLFIADLRKEKNLTQKMLASKLYVSDKAVSKWERGICMPDIALIEKLAQILEVNVSDILKGEKVKKMTKQNTDEIVKSSITFFEKRYFKNKITKILITLIIIFPLLYLSLLIIGEFNNGKIALSIWGNTYSKEVPTFSLIKSKKVTKKYLNAISNYDYETIELLLEENIEKNNSLLNDWITYKEYINSLKYLEKAKVYLTSYKLLFCYNYNRYLENNYSLDYTCEYDLTFKYDDIYYKKGARLKHSNGKVSVSDIYLTSDNYNYWTHDKNTGKNYNSIYNIKNKEIIKNIENIFFKY